MNENIGEIMNKILSDVMEQMAFMFVSEAEPIDPALDRADFVKVSMLFHGPLEGELTMVASQRMCVELASNILGLEADDPMVMESATDALKEILNVICGHLITSVAGERLACIMAPPVAVCLTPEEWDSLDLSDKTWFFSVEEHPVLLQFQLERGEQCQSVF